MDKDKVINEILMEWAMRSPDGLVGGHDTPENMAVLNEILSEYGLSQEALTFDQAKINATGKQYFDKDASGELVTAYHPIYVDGQTLDAVKAGTAVTRAEYEKMSDKEKQQVLGIVPTSTPRNVKKTEFTMENLTGAKKFPPSVAKGILDCARKYLKRETYEEFVNEHYDNYNSVDSAIEFANTANGDERYKRFLEALEDEARGKAETSVGRGEYIFTLLMRGAKTRGQKSGDLELSSGLVIDIKELDPGTGEGGIFRVPLTVFGGIGQFNRMRFPNAINQFFSYCIGNKKAQEILINIVQYDVKTISDSEYYYVMRFLHELSWDTIGKKTLDGLVKIMAHIQKIPPSELEALGIGNKVEFDIDGEEHLLAIEKIPTSEKEKIENPKLKQTPVTVSVSAITDKDSEIIVPQLKSLELFKKPSKKSEAFVANYIADEMFSNMKHYTGGIIFCRRTSKKAKIGNYYYEPDLKKMKRPFGFYNYAQSAVGFKRV